MRARNRIFIYGYHGFRNLGAEARLISMITNLRARCTNVDITVSTFAKGATDYIARDYGVKLAEVHPVWHKRAAARHISNCDIMMLAEGNMLTDEFTPLMIEVFGHAIESAKSQGKYVIGMALDSGRISDKRRDRMVRALNGIDLLTVRAPSAATELRRLGVTIPIAVTADCALSAPLPSQEIIDRIERKTGLAEHRLHAVAPVDFHMWPAKVALFGRRDEYLRWPIKATWADGGREMSARLIDDWVRYVDHLLREDRSCIVPILVMDPADGRIAQHIAARVSDTRRVKIYAGAEFTPLEMSSIMSKFSSITTSRYHALVMPLPYGAPFIALGHDTRTKFIAEHLSVPEAYVWFEQPDRVERLIELHRKLAGAQDAVDLTRARILRGVATLTAADQRNYDLASAAIEGGDVNTAQFSGLANATLEAAQ